jgi:hypothetical protein
MRTFAATPTSLTLVEKCALQNSFEDLNRLTITSFQGKTKLARCEELRLDVVLSGAARL